MNWPGFFLVFDGIDGCGKSTQAKKLFNYLNTKNIPAYLTAEPTKNELGKILRTYLQNPDIPASLDALIFAADRLEHCRNEILPKLNEKFIVISDRYRDSSYIYQSIEGRNEGVSLDWIKTLNKFSLIPDLTIIIDIDPKIGLKRKSTQSAADNGHLEKFENDDFQKIIREEFIKIAKNSMISEEGTHILLQGNRTEEEVFKAILAVIMPLLEKKNLLTGVK